MRVRYRFRHGRVLSLRLLQIDPCLDVLGRHALWGRAQSRSPDHHFVVFGVRINSQQHFKTTYYDVGK